ncbi:MAG TPA: 3-hydroxyacyl-ACP dehydratase FabZ [Kiritimatiellia bacterium]|nr:3-hydroxyacyl-ACP dehydratase FabZ [Kiritimatiellia bacterium]HMO98270.1 3-hydroxyacyl-ACP dehydratase FabZ [Kiritimatiellia bacterium]HMP96267.1 3-hydroxyacyl-ACP dehydratase FabZ [Kiritimatiellia bacterium]
MDINAIQTILPHRYPLQMVDRVVEYDVDQQRIVAIKCVSANDPYLQGHFPEFMCMPGVLQLEAMAQAGGVLMSSIFGMNGKIAYFLSIDKAKFRRVVRPGDVMRIEVTFQKARLRVSRMKGVITVDGELASEAEMMFTYREE